MKYIGVCFLILLASCGHIDSAVNRVQTSLGKIERKVTLYDSGGAVIKTWKTTNVIESRGPSGIAFVDIDGVHVRITGIIIIEQTLHKKEVEVKKIESTKEENPYYTGN